MGSGRKDGGKPDLGTEEEEGNDASRTTDRDEERRGTTGNPQGGNQGSKGNR